MRKLLIGLGAAVLCATTITTFAAEPCVVGNTCPYKVWGMRNLKVNITNLQPKKQYTCTFTVNGSNIDKVAVTNIYSIPANIEVNMPEPSSPIDSKMKIDTSNIDGIGNVYFDFHDSRFPWQSNSVSVSCH